MGKWTGETTAHKFASKLQGYRNHIVSALGYYATWNMDSRRLLTVMHAARRWNAPPVLVLPVFKFGQ
ncbi:hypothetical protein NC652_005633 [Populus alba x Populus x berolinensis]|nr:hypothetical protein NC652_005633 [Populus alba x Populus x berolinensis]